jgi:hypothetical protein
MHENLHRLETVISTNNDHHILFYLVNQCNSNYTEFVLVQRSIYNSNYYSQFTFSSSSSRICSESHSTYEQLRSARSVFSLPLSWYYIALFNRQLFPATSIVVCIYHQRLQPWLQCAHCIHYLSICIPATQFSLTIILISKHKAEISVTNP